MNKISAKCKSKNITAFIAALLYMLCFLQPSALSIACVQENSSVTVYKLYIAGNDTGIDISGINAICTAKLTAFETCKLSIKMELQKKKSGVYETIKTWSSSKTGLSLSMSEKRAINLLSDYRLKTTFTAGTEKQIKYAYPA